MAPAAVDPPPAVTLDALRRRLALPGLELAEPPVRVTGGYETHIYALRLAGAPPELSGPLILRLFVRPGSAIGALVEYDVYQFLAGAGFPAPFAHQVCDDGAGLEGPWILMDRVP
ncbi:MAG: phosphotransferase, partial [Dehalococcoidia bacterium]